jgi:hypothetical protein
MRAQKDVNESRQLIQKAKQLIKRAREAVIETEKTIEDCKARSFTRALSPLSTENTQ